MNLPKIFRQTAGIFRWLRKNERPNCRRRKPGGQGANRQLDDCEIGKWTLAYEARQTWGVEVKAAVTATPADGQGLRRLAEQCGADYRGGVLLYAGGNAFNLGDGHHLAMPLARLWEM